MGEESVSLDRFGELADASADVLWMFDRDWSELLFVNDAYEEIWGRSREALYREPLDFLDGVHPADRDRVTAAMETLSGGESVEIEYRVNATEEYGRWVWVQGEPILNDDGEVVRIAGFARDVTDRKERQRELTLRKERFSALFENLGEPVVEVVFLEGEPIVTEVNAAFTEAFGLGAEVEGRNLDDLIVPETGMEAAVSINERSIEGETIEREVRRGTDEYRWYLLRSAPFDGPEGRERGHAIYVDISELKKRQRQLRQSKRRYRRLVDISPSPIFVYSIEGELEYANDAAVSFLGATDPEEVLGTDAGQFTHPDSEADVERRRRRLVEDREPVPPVEQKVVDVDGEIKYGILASTPTTYEGDPAIQTVATDITEQKKRQRELQRQNERLDDFASVVSHDLRNPLNVARGRLELAREDCESPHLATVASAHERMESLLDDLLTLARSGDQVRDPQAVDLAALLEECRETVATAEATVVTDLDARVRADRGRLRQLFENLIRNAVEHAGDDVRVTVGELEDTPGFYVADDGPGIPEADRQRVFESGYTTDESGTGFGLKIVREIVRAHDWTIDVTESETGGARFEVAGVTFDR